MTAICQCCGQRDGDVSTSGRNRPHWVEDALLACFNRAHEDAEQRGMAEVGVAHLLLAMTAAEDVAAAMTRSGIDPQTLATLIDATLPQRRPYGRSDRPRSAADLRTLLDIAQRTASIAGQTFITKQIMLSTLLSLPSALTGVHELARWIWAARRYPGVGAAGPEMTQPYAEARATPVVATDFTWLEARLARQEQLLQSLQDQLRAASIEIPPPQPAASPPEPARLEPAKFSTPPAALTPKSDFVPDEIPDDDDLDDEDAQATGIKRYYLSMDDEIVRAPSIGPATAARLQPHGITHVKHLLAIDPERLSARLGARHLTTTKITAWKNQARLVCSIPWLRGTHAQLLVGAGYASIEKILSADRPVVCAAIMQFATTRDGQSILRNGQPPEMDRIMRWIENSQHAEPQRAEPTRAGAAGLRVVG